jgi:hypothetical protein
MRRSTETRLDRLQQAFTAPDSGLYVQYVSFASMRTRPDVTGDEQLRLAAIADQLNAHVDALVAEHGPGILREHRCRNDALGVLPLEDLEFVCEIIERDPDNERGTP